MAKCDACKTEFEDLFIIEDGTKLCARCLEMDALRQDTAPNPTQTTVVLDQDKE